MADGRAAFEPVDARQAAEPTPEVARGPAHDRPSPQSVMRRAVGNQAVGRQAVGRQGLGNPGNAGRAATGARGQSDPDERAAQEAEVGRRPGSRVGGALPGRSPLAGDEGRPVPGEPGVRVHESPADHEFVALLGAQAATHGRDIFLGAGRSACDQALMRHELAHVHQGGDQLRLRRATYLERRTWLAFFDHYLPRRFLNNYMDDTGTPIRLSLQQMQDCNPIVDLRRSRVFMRQVARIAAAGGGSGAMTFTGWAGARTNGTLGNFTIEYTGTVVVQADGTWSFSGTMTFRDFWDFNTGGANRPLGAEVKVMVASTFLPGRPFDITSVAAAVSQSSTDSRATWGSGAAPVHVPDRAGRTGADIVVGDVVGGPVGGEIGPQASEDLN